MTTLVLGKQRQNWQFTLPILPYQSSYSSFLLFSNPARVSAFVSAIIAPQLNTA